ncbi:unnamed protein product [Brassica rapa]|uniref:Uncharacterized protein n=1 Tax=Brassica campestris TaxID=3711 RepID=A0A8D9CW46_BRACM|nr:unnamed protein product [Brassica rapa]
MFLMVSTHDVKRFGLDKVKDFCVSNSVYDRMLKSFKELEPDKLFDQKCFQYGNKNFSGHVLSFEGFMNHHEKILEPVFKPTEFYFRKLCDLFARTEENSFVVNLPRNELISDYFLASTYVSKEPRKLHEPKLHHSDVRVENVKFANISDFELDCLCAKNDSQRVGLFFEVILVYNTFFDKPVAQLKLEFTDSECMNLILDDIWVCNIFFDMNNRWRNHAVLCFGDILVYNTFFYMITHLTCPKQAEKGTGEERGYNDQSIHDESLAKLEMQQSNLGSCLAASFNIGAVRGSYLSTKKELSNKLNCNGNYTHQGLTSNWNHVQSFSYERVMNSTSRVILCLLCLNFSEFRTSQTYLWRPESCADYMEALKHTKGRNKREEDKRFKPPDLNQERHQDVTCFILIKEAPPDAAYKPKPIKYNFGIRLLLYDVFACVHLSCFNVSGLSNASGVRRAKWISPFYIIEPVSDNAYQRGLQGKSNLIINSDVTDLVPSIAGKTDLRSNLFEVGGDDVIMESTKEWKHEPEELVAEDASFKNAWKQEEYIGLGRSLIIQETLPIIQATPPSS